MGSSALPDPGSLRFGEFELELDSGRLRRGALRVPLRNRSARLLALLALRAGETVTRDEIRAALWGHDTFIRFDQGVADCLREVRAALGDSATRPRFVETLPRRGYRFLAPVAAEARSAPGARVESRTQERTRRPDRPAERRTAVVLRLIRWLLQLDLRPAAGSRPPATQD